MENYQNLRFSAISNCLKHHAKRDHIEETNISDYFASNVFNRIAMRQYLSKEAFEILIQAIDGGEKLERKHANQIAIGMKNWAIEKGATHYTHWFQPLNGSTAEKHDAFIEIDKDRNTFENFSGDLLIQQEPDASSFPSGGLRNTFEARGYTAWDPSSPAFIIDETLCIPTVFVSYTGEALDYKTSLLKSQEAINETAVEICQLFDKNVRNVSVSLGLEQEYFVIDSALFYARPDLIQTGRTLMGHTPAKDQQLEDHYFGSIPIKIAAFMKDFETEAYKLGIPLKTRHNEVAPHQFECAPTFEEANLAIDHNQLLMCLMKKIAKQHNLKILFHEKPFAGINGSGKHCNWSLMTNTGKNLLSPGKTPRNNLQFLTFFVCTIKAALKHGYLLMSSIESLSNSLRLGGQEAPPAILSVFLGNTLSNVLDSLENSISETKMTPDEKTDLKLNIVGKIPEIMPDNTDRNRTSPFAFTGNRFEFRAPGSSCNASAPTTVINTAVAQQLKLFKENVDLLISNGIKKDEAIFQTLKKYIKETKDIRFEGNGYSSEWHKEAKERGLKIINSITDAFDAYTSEESKSLFKEFNIFSEKELYARNEILNEEFVKKLQIESRVLGDIAINHIIPTAIKYQNILIENIKGINSIFKDENFQEYSQTQLKILKDISTHINEIRSQTTEMIQARKNANKLDSYLDKAISYNKYVLPFLESIRYHIDKLELEVDDSMWSLPKYREMLLLH